MKKIKEILKNNIKLILGIAIGIAIPIASAYAATIYYQGSNVGYNNSKTGFKDSNGNNVEDVQTALDELYTKASKTVTLDGLENVGFQTNSAKTIFANSNGVCINRNNKLNCFKLNNWSVEKDHIQQVFSDRSCDGDSSYVECSTSDFDCYVYSGGGVDCMDLGNGSFCFVDSDGSVDCH